MNIRIGGAVGAICFTSAHPLVAQLRSVDLTGVPSKSFSTPITSVTKGVELANGRFLFVDRSEVSVLLADFSSDKLMVLGGPGAGPGEYRVPSHPVSDGKGGAIVADQALGRALLVSGAGVVQGTGLTREEIDGSPSAIRGMDSLGRLYRMGRQGAMGRDSMPIERWDPASKVTKHVAWWPMVRTIIGPPIKGPDGKVGTSITSATMFPLRTEWAVLPDGSVAMVYPSPYRVEVISPDGKRVRGRNVPFSPVQVTEAYRNWIAKVRGPIPKENFPATLPPFEDAGAVLASIAGEIWVGRTRDWNDSIPKYDIFDKQGALVGRSTLRPHSRVIGFGRGVVYVARQSVEDDFWHLEQYRVTTSFGP